MLSDLLDKSSDISAAKFAQPVCTAVQLALVNLLRQWGILPSGVVGHSSGEIAAAYAAGALGMKEALLISYYRGVAATELRRPGAMAAVGLGRAELADLLVGNVVVACENSQSSSTISGNLEDVEASLDQISQARPGVLARKLKVDRAYHSSKYYQAHVECLPNSVRSYANSGQELSGFDRFRSTKIWKTICTILFKRDRPHYRGCRSFRSILLARKYGEPGLVPFWCR